MVNPSLVTCHLLNAIDAARAERDAERSRAVDAEAGLPALKGACERALVERDGLRATARRLREAAEKFCAYHEAIVALGPECDCPGDGHVCGWTKYKRETVYMRAALAETAPQEGTC